MLPRPGSLGSSLLNGFWVADLRAYAPDGRAAMDGGRLLFVLVALATLAGRPPALVAVDGMCFAGEELSQRGIVLGRFLGELVTVPS